MEMEEDLKKEMFNKQKALRQKSFTEEWKLYEKGKEYHDSIGLYEHVNLNERFYRGDQWNGVPSGGLPTPVFNLFRRIIDYFISTVLSGAVQMRFTSDSPSTLGGRSGEEAAEMLNRITEYRWEKQKMDTLIAAALRDAAITGDAVCYTYWDPAVRTGQAYTGDFVSVLVDNTNVFFGNPNSKNIEKQPYILLSMRETVEDLRAQAKANGRSEEEIRKITSDSDIGRESGDLAKKELEHTRCISLIKLWRNEEGHICFRKSVRDAVIREETDLGLTRYPIAVMNWTPVKNSWHGQAVATGLIENQIFINKSFAMVMKHMMDTAFSKVVYDSTVIDEWSNRVGEAVAVNGPVENVAKVLSSGQMQAGMLDVIKLAISATKEFMGATDTALGDVTPTNTSAILALQQSSNMPLEGVKRSLYQFVEDIGLIWLDFLFAYYDDARLVPVRGESGKSGQKYLPFSFSSQRERLFGCRVDVGAGSYWSEITSLNTLDNLLKMGQITLAQYLERLPDNLIPKKRELLEEVRQTLAQASADSQQEEMERSHMLQLDSAAEKEE